MMKQLHGRLRQWSTHLPIIRRSRVARTEKGDQRRVDHDGLGFFHALIPALLLSLLLWCLLLL